VSNTETNPNPESSEISNTGNNLGDNEQPVTAGNRHYPVKRTLFVGILLLAGLVSLFQVGIFFGIGLLLIGAIVAARILPYRLNPLTAKKLKRFREIKRGYYSFLFLGVLTVLSMFSELFVNSRALVVMYDGKLYLPTYSKIFLGSEFGLEGVEGNIPVDFRELDKVWEESSSENWILMPLIPFGPNEQTPDPNGFLKYSAPSAELEHYLGTDTTGRDILARLVYGFRIAILFAIAFMMLTYVIGITIGCLMGFFGGVFDILVQRLIEVWSNIPFLYMVIIIFSVIPSSFDITTRIFILLSIMVLFSWTGMTYYMRTATYREKARDYSAAAVVLGASTPRVIFNHILPNTISTIVTFMPFTVVAAITAITALDFLGFGLPAPTPSMGELLKQGRDNLREAPWIVSSAFSSLVILLCLVSFIGEAVREAFDPRKFTTYK
jgi:microcin C transport system permease protein